MGNCGKLQCISICHNRMADKTVDLSKTLKLTPGKTFHLSLQQPLNDITIFPRQHQQQTQKNIYSIHVFEIRLNLTIFIDSNITIKH